MPTETLDPEAVNLAKAIRQTESGGNFTAKGKSGEYGAYQFTEPTWNATAAKYGVNVPLAQATPEQQNEVAYKQVKEWKDQGNNVGQIASMWNAGEAHKDAYLDTSYQGVNKAGAQYNVPAYAKSVATAYQTLKSGGQVSADPQNPSSTANTQNAPNPPEKSFLEQAGGDIGSSLQGTANAISDTAQGKINPLSGLLQGAGSLAKGVGDVTNDALTHLPIVGGLVKGAEGLIGKGVQAIANTNTGQGIAKDIGDFSQAHPELAGDIGAVGNIAGAIPAFKGIGIAKDVLETGAKAALTGSKDAILETIAPKMTAKETAEAVANRGTSKSGILGKITVNPDSALSGIKDTIQKFVPDFNPAKGLAHNINATKAAVSKMATDLKNQVIQTGKDRIYSFKEFASNLNALPKPTLLVGDMEKVYGKVIGKALEIAKQSGGKVSSLLDVRKEFDSFVGKEFPNLYSSDALTPMRTAIKNIRNGITDFTEKNLPEGNGLKQSLLNQHKLLTAIENMSEKVSSGAEKEIGTTNIERFGNRHPVIKGLIKGATRAITTGAGIKGAEDLLP